VTIIYPAGPVDVASRERAMVYISSWQQFQREAEALYTKHPKKTRYCVKWRAVENSLVLKITDDNTCLKYKTSSSFYFHRFQALNLSLMEKMQNRKPTAHLPAAVETEGATTSPRAGTPVTPAAAQPHAPPGGKKKGKKKK